MLLLDWTPLELHDLLCLAHTRTTYMMQTDDSWAWSVCCVLILHTLSQQQRQRCKDLQQAAVCIDQDLSIYIYLRIYVRGLNNIHTSSSISYAHSLTTVHIIYTLLTVLAKQSRKPHNMQEQRSRSKKAGHHPWWCDACAPTDALLARFITRLLWIGVVGDQGLARVARISMYARTG